MDRISSTAHDSSPAKKGMKSVFCHLNQERTVQRCFTIFAELCTYVFFMFFNILSSREIRKDWNDWYLKIRVIGMAKARLIGFILGGIIQCGYATFLSEGEIRTPINVLMIPTICPASSKSSVCPSVA